MKNTEKYQIVKRSIDSMFDILHERKLDYFQVLKDDEYVLDCKTMNADTTERLQAAVWYISRFSLTLALERGEIVKL